MKKITLFVAFVALGLAAGAQTLNVQSAISDLQNANRETKTSKIYKFLSRAKTEIDEACENENTKSDAKTWCYAALIYSQIGDQSTKPDSKFREECPDWCEKALNAAMRCKELDKNNEFANLNNPVFRFVGNEYYSRAVNAYNEEKDYAKCITLCEEAIKIFNNSGDTKYSDDAYYLAGLSAKVQKNNDAILKYFKPLVRRKTDKKEVYRTLFNIYKDNKQTDDAMKLANNYVKFYPNDYNATMLQAEAYLLAGNVEKGNETINKALEQTKDKPEVYAQLLGVAAATLENTNDYAGAEAKYQESLRLRPNQFEANFGLGKMIFNRGVDKLDAANNVPPDDETGLYDKLIEESNGFFRQAIQYFQSSVAYIDALPEGDAKNMQRANLFNTLSALKQIYVRLEMYDDLKPINARLDAIQVQANQ